MTGMLSDSKPSRLVLKGAVLAAILLGSGGSVIADGGEKATSPQEEQSPQEQRSLIERVSHTIFQPFWQVERAQVEPFRLPSKYYGPWEPTEVFGRDARCAPRAFAPRGYGIPNHLSLYRMEYTPYRLSDCPHSTHGPAMWMRHHRDPCCDASGRPCHECLDRSVDPQ